MADLRVAGFEWSLKAQKGIVAAHFAFTGAKSTFQGIYGAFPAWVGLTLSADSA